METLEQIKDWIAAAVPGAAGEVTLLPNPACPAQSSLVVSPRLLEAVALFLRDDPRLRLDFCSNVTGVDWLDRTVKRKVKRVVEGQEKEVEESEVVPGYLEVVYHLFSVARKAGPVVLRVRTPDRAPGVSVPSLVRVWRSCELQEREVYDLYGVGFDGHPDLRRLLMWEGFRDHPMRKDYAAPDDFEYEPTAHDEVRVRAEANRQQREAAR